MIFIKELTVKKERMNIIYWVFEISIFNRLLKSRKVQFINNIDC